MCGKIRKEKIKNECFQERLGIEKTGDKIRVICLRWFGHVQRRPAAAPVRKILVIKIDMNKCNFSDNLAQGKLECKKEFAQSTPT